MCPVKENNDYRYEGWALVPVHKTTQKNKEQNPPPTPTLAYNPPCIVIECKGSYLAGVVPKPCA